MITDQFFSILLVSIFSLAQQSAATATPYHFDTKNALISPGDRLEMRLTTDRSTYATSEPIKVSVQVTNLLSQNLAVIAVAPWEAVTLVVFKNGASPLPVPTNRSTHHWRMPLDTVLKSGEAFTYRWSDVDPTAMPDYYDISNWGYASLPPGHYTLIAWPFAAGSDVQGKAFGLNRKSHSNAVDVTVVP